MHDNSTAHFVVEDCCLEKRLWWSTFASVHLCYRLFLLKFFISSLSPAVFVSSSAFLLFSLSAFLSALSLCCFSVFSLLVAFYLSVSGSVSLSLSLFSFLLFWIHFLWLNAAIFFLWILSSFLLLLLLSLSAITFCFLLLLLLLNSTFVPKCCNFFSVIFFVKSFYF